MLKQQQALCIICIALIFCYCSTQRAFAITNEDDVFGTFELLCISKLGHPQLIQSSLAQMGAKLLSDSEAAPVLAPKSGQAWVLTGLSQNRMVILLTDEGVCAVYSNDAKSSEIKRIFEKNIKNTKLGKEDIGSQNAEGYAITQYSSYDSKDIRAVVIISTSKLSSFNGTSLNAIPEELARKNGITPKWP